MNANARRTRLGTFEFRRARFHRRAAACGQPRGGQTSDLSHADGFLPPKASFLIQKELDLLDLQKKMETKFPNL